MSEWGEKKLTKTEYYDRLEFQLEQGDASAAWFQTIVSVLVSGAVLYYLFLVSSSYFKIVAMFVALGICASLALRTLDSGTALLTISTEGLELQRDRGKGFRSRLNLAIEDIAPIYFHPGYDDDEPTILVRHGWQNSALLVGVTREQARMVLESIREKFPEMQVDPDLHEFSLDDLGLVGSKPITLGLTNHDPNTPKRS